MNGSVPRRRVLGFLDHLRDEGYTIGVGETADIMALLVARQRPSRQFTQRVTRALVCRDLREWRQFDRLFRQYWFPEELALDEQDVLARIDPRQRNTGAGLAGSSSEAPDSAYGDAGLRGSGAGSQRTITRVDYRFLNDRRAMRQAEALAERLAWKMKNRLARRHTYRSRGVALDLRRTLRRSLSTAGFPARRLFRVRKAEQPRLVILHDISHSMAWNNPLLFRFARGLTRAFRDVHAFAFHIHLFPVTDIYRSRSLDTMREKLEADNHLGMGGTCIARSLAEFVERFGRRCLSSGTVVLIISDGLDTDAPERLQEELEALRARVRSIVWLNPMLGREGVTLTTESLRQTLPAVDGFYPANSLDGLQRAIARIAGQAG